MLDETTARPEEPLEHSMAAVLNAMPKWLLVSFVLLVGAASGFLGSQVWSYEKRDVARLEREIKAAREAANLNLNERVAVVEAQTRILMGAMGEFNAQLEQQRSAMQELTRQLERFNARAEVMVERGGRR